jgi:hypothetical protein
MSVFRYALCPLPINMGSVPISVDGLENKKGETCKREKSTAWPERQLCLAKGSGKTNAGQVVVGAKAVVSRSTRSLKD